MAGLCASVREEEVKERLRYCGVVEREGGHGMTYGKNVVVDDAGDGL